MCRCCLICGISAVEYARQKRVGGGATACGVDTSSEAGFDWRPLSDRHRWADWSNHELTRFGIVPEAFDKHRRMRRGSIPRDCDDTARPHEPSQRDVPDRGIRQGDCLLCGAPARQAPETETRNAILCPECRDGKCRNCDGSAWDDEVDAPASCECDHQNTLAG